MTIEEHVRLAPLTTFRIGGKARFFARAQSVGDMTEATAFAKKERKRFFVLGGGSNVLISDSGFPGLVIKNELLGISFDTKGKRTRLVAGAGENWDDIVALSVSKGLYGIENLSGIPGSVGASPVQNIGAYGSEVCDSIEWVEAYDAERGKTLQLAASECAFGYRDSVFKKSAAKKLIVTKVAYALSKTGEMDYTYKDLAEYFLKRKTEPALLEMRSAVLEIRKKKFPDITKHGTAGSYFKNPIVTTKELEELLSKFRDVPHHPFARGRHKISLAYIIDKVCGLKGERVGDAMVSSTQALSLLNGGGASAADMRALSDKVADAVRQKTGLTIEPEVEFVE